LSRLQVLRWITKQRNAREFLPSLRCSLAGGRVLGALTHFEGEARVFPRLPLPVLPAEIAARLSQGELVSCGLQALTAQAWLGMELASNKAFYSTAERCTQLLAFLSARRADLNDDCLRPLRAMQCVPCVPVGPAGAAVAAGAAIKDRLALPREVLFPGQHPAGFSQLSPRVQLVEDAESKGGGAAEVTRAFLKRLGVRDAPDLV
jgi:hypothetical protein